MAKPAITPMIARAPSTGLAATKSPNKIDTTPLTMSTHSTRLASSWRSVIAAAMSNTPRTSAQAAMKMISANPADAGHMIVSTPIATLQTPEELPAPVAIADRRPERDEAIEQREGRKEPDERDDRRERQNDRKHAEGDREKTAHDEHPPVGEQGVRGGRH